MIVGDPHTLALESAITQVYATSGLALGFFVLHVGGFRYGVYEPDATLLGNSYDAVRNRLARRGKHTAPFADEPDAGKIADSFRRAIYSEEPAAAYFSIPHTRFENIVLGNHLVWAPDGDEAFDDGSYVLQFDIQGVVRVLAFRCSEDGLHDPATLRELWSPSDNFYRLLEDWLAGFERERAAFEPA